MGSPSSPSTVVMTGSAVPARESLNMNQNNMAPYEIFKIGIALPPEELKKRIHARLTKRLREGMIREVEHLHKNGLSWKRLDDLGLEYRLVSHYLRERISKNEMMSRIEIESFHYAKRQMTWWKRDKGIMWCPNTSEALRESARFMRR